MTQKDWSLTLYFLLYAVFSLTGQCGVQKDNAPREPRLNEKRRRSAASRGLVTSRSGSRLGRPVWQHTGREGGCATSTAD